MERPGDVLGPRAGNFPSGPPSGLSLGAVLGACWAVLEASGNVLGPSWAVLGPSSTVFGRSWGPLGPPWSVGKPKTGKPPKPSKSIERLMILASRGPFGRSLEGSWAVLAASWTVLGSSSASWSALCSSRSRLGPFWRSPRVRVARLGAFLGPSKSRDMMLEP